MEKKSAKLIYKLIFWFVFAIAALLLLVHWKYSLCALGVLLWNDIFYENGCQEFVCDEWETGYPTQGLYRMFQSWIWLAIILAIVLYFIV
ncbi:MAG: hypothetical protein NC218_00885 [Acetobacter sp.]|nr:hypothetical protein [Acetobacter sp.]